MAALVVAAMAQVGDRPAWLAAILADRFGKPILVVAMALLAIALASVAAAFAGVLLAPQLTPEAEQFFLALALVILGGGGLIVVKQPDRLERWRIGAAATSFMGLAILAFGDGVQMVVLALALRSSLPWLAPVGATLGSLVVLIPAVFLGERRWCMLPLRRVRAGVGVVLIVAGLALGLAAIGLV